MQSYRNHEWVSSLYMDLYNIAYTYDFFWIGDIETDSLDIALYTECKTLFLRYLTNRHIHTTIHWNISRNTSNCVCGSHIYPEACQALRGCWGMRVWAVLIWSCGMVYHNGSPRVRGVYYYPDSSRVPFYIDLRPDAGFIFAPWNEWVVRYLLMEDRPDHRIASRVGQVEQCVQIGQQAVPDSQSIPR